MAALPAPNSVGSVMALNGPFRGRFAIRNSLSLSAREIFGPDGFVARDTTAGTADRCDRILVDVSCSFECRGNDFRTGVSVGFVQSTSRIVGERTLLVALGIDYEQLIVRLFLQYRAT